MFPNPVIDVLNLSIEIGKEDVILYNVLGEAQELIFQDGENFQEIDVKDLQPRVYFLKING